MDNLIKSCVCMTMVIQIQELILIKQMKSMDGKHIHTKSEWITS